MNSKDGKLQGRMVRKRMLEFMIRYFEEHGYAPSYDEIGEAVNLSSKSSIHSHMMIMYREGMIETDAGVGFPRAFRIPGYEFRKKIDLSSLFQNPKPIEHTEYPMNDIKRNTEQSRGHLYE